MPTCFLVLGTPRSGTSMVAGVLHHLGVRMGEHIEGDRWDWGGPDEWNGKGHFADAAIGNWGNAVFGVPPCVDREIESGEREQLASIIKHRQSFGVDWGCKHHVLPWFAEQIAPMATSVKIIVTHRQEKRSIESWAARSGDSLEKAREIVFSAKQRIADVLHSIDAPRMFVNFDNIIDHSASRIRKIAAFVGRAPTPEALSFPSREMRRF